MDREELVYTLGCLRDDIGAKQLEVEEKEGEKYDKLYSKLEEYYEALGEAIGWIEQLNLIHDISRM